MSDRKYRQSGYQDSSSDKPRRSSAPPRRDPAEGPRGRGFGKPTATVFRCAVCGTRNAADEVRVDSTCDKCKTDLHSCTHCVAFAPSMLNECRHPDLPHVSSKASANSCESFAPKASQEFAQESSDKPTDPKAAFDALFNF